MNNVIVEISARHVHLSRAHVDILFGKGYQLTFKRDLSQPGQFTCEERIRVEGEKSAFPSVIILGPERPDSQVEISLTDARTIGVNAPVRESGDVAGSGKCKLVGPSGEVELACGVMAAKRHMHVTPEDAEAFGVFDKQIISIETEETGRRLVFSDVVVRVSPKFATRVHIDTDEANAAGLTGESKGIVIL